MKTRSHSHLPLAVLAGLALFAAPANATIITPTTATVAVGGSTNTNITSTIDGSGLSGGGTSGDILSETHAADTTQWISGANTSPNVEVVFDLGGTFNVDSVHLWNFGWSNGITGWGTQTMDISFSTDGGSSYANTVQDLAFTENVSLSPIPVQTLDLLVSPFPTTIIAQNAPVTTDGSGIGQAIINAADASGARGFFQMAYPAP